MEQNRVLDVLTSKELTYEQKVFSLAMDIPPKTRQYFETGALNDLFEGHAPYPTAQGISCRTIRNL